MVEILADFFVLMVFFYRRFLPLGVCIYAFGAENDDSSSNLPIPFGAELKEISDIRGAKIARLASYKRA